MYTIPATPVHCFARGCAHHDPLRCLMRAPPFYITKPKPPASKHGASSPPFEDASDCSSSGQHSAQGARRTSDRLAKSRATGQSYRDNERQHIFRLITAVENGRLENTLLFVLFSYAYKRQLVDTLHRHHEHLCQLPNDTSEDHAPYMSAFTYPLSPESQIVLGQRAISGAMATVLLELLMHRRNMWGTTHAMHVESVPCDASCAPRCDADRRRRRRPPYRTATTSADADAVVTFATRLFSRERAAPRANHVLLLEHVQRRLAHLTVVAYHLDHCEAVRNTVYSLCDGRYEAVVEEPPLSPTTPDGAEFGSWLKLKRGDGAKRCSRCGVLKITGSGHARSKCSDGLSISSKVPFPASPASPASDEEVEEEEEEVMELV